MLGTDYLSDAFVYFKLIFALCSALRKGPFANKLSLPVCHDLPRLRSSSELHNVTILRDTYRLQVTACDPHDPPEYALELQKCRVWQESLAIFTVSLASDLRVEPGPLCFGLNCFDWNLFEYEIVPTEILRAP